MKKLRLLSCILLTLVLVFTLIPAVYAEVELADEESALTGEHDATVLLAGSNPVSSADVRGILFAAGNTVSADGSGEYVFLAGNTVALNGSCARDAFVAGNNVGVSGSVGRDLVIAGSNVTVGGEIGRDVYAGGQTVYIGGKIGGNVVLDANEIQISDSAEIKGTLRYNSSAKITAPAGILHAASTFENEHVDTPASVSVESAKPSPFAKVKSLVFGFLGLVLIAYALLWLTPLWEKLDADYTGADFGKYAASFGIGFAVLAGLPLASILLMITGIGLRAAFILLLLYAAAIIAAPVFFGFFLGVLVWRRLFKQRSSYWAELPIGLLIWRLLTLIPGVKVAVGLVVVPLGLGVLTRLLGKKKTPSPAPALPEIVE